MSTTALAGRGRTRGSGKVAAADCPYTLRLRDGRTLVVEIPGKWTMVDRDGAAALLPPAVQMLDRIRVLLSKVSAFLPLTPGYITTLRKALGLTQQQFGARLGVDKMTVYRWERGTVKPGPQSLARLERLRKQALREGVTLPG